MTDWLRTSIGPPAPGPMGGGGPLGPSPPGALVAESILRGRPLSSRPARLRTALIAVCGSSYSQNPKPRGLPVAGSYISLFGNTHTSIIVLVVV